MINVTFLFFISFLLFSMSSNAHVRNVFPKNDEIILIKTSIAIATIIQFPDSTSIQMPIIGDQSGFRIENLDKGITIKPLRQNAKTNLYLFTDKKRYNFRLVTSSQDEADYIVYIKSTVQSHDIKWMQINKTVANSGLSLTVVGVSSTKDQTIVLDCILKFKSSHAIAADSFWIFQRKDSKVINSIFLPDKFVIANRPFRFGLALSKNDLSAGQPIELDYKSKQYSLSVEIAKEALWK